MWNCLWGNALKRSPGINRKSRVSYPSPGFLSSATWPPLPKKHYNGLILCIYIHISVVICQREGKCALSRADNSADMNKSAKWHCGRHTL